MFKKMYFHDYHFGRVWSNASHLSIEYGLYEDNSTWLCDPFEGLGSNPRGGNHESFNYRRTLTTR